MTWQLAFGVTLALAFITLVLEKFGQTHLSLAVAANAVWSLSLLVTSATLTQTAPLLAIAFAVVAFGRMAYVIDAVRRRGLLTSPASPAGQTPTPESLRTRNRVVILVTGVGVVLILASVLIQPH